MLKSLLLSQMFLKHIDITEDLFVTDIVRLDYRTARVFKKHDIDFCCGGRWTLGTVCELKGIDLIAIMNELEHSVKKVQLSNSIRFDNWSIDFLIGYIINVHHHYLRNELPGIKDQLDRFTEAHAKKYPHMKEVQEQFRYVYQELIPHLTQEEEILFPYIRQIAHAYDSKELYASLLVRTLRKPVENVMQHEHDFISKSLQNIRTLTSNYHPPEKSCISHDVTYSLLKELDNDLVQHLYLENEILFPKAIAMEKELLLKR